MLLPPWPACRSSSGKDAMTSLTRSRFERNSAIALSKGDLQALNAKGWGLVLGTLEAFTEEDLERAAPVRGAERPLLHALIYHWSHYSYHIGQIVFLAKLATQGEWDTAAAKARIKDAGKDAGPVQARPAPATAGA